MKSHLHIGLNNVIGAAVKAQGINTISHFHDFKTLKDYEYISISAFDPALKLSDGLSFDLVNKVIKMSSKSTKILYISSCRVFDDPENKFSTYTKNKKNEERLLRQNFDNVSAIYLPNIIEEKHGVIRNNFLRIFMENLKINRIVFDVSMQSSWNFVLDKDIASIIASTKMWREKIIALSATDTKIADLHSIATNLIEGVTTRYGENIVRYPKYTPYEIIHTKIDLGSNLNWVHDKINLLKENKNV